MLSSGLAGPARARPSDAASDTSSVASGTQLAEGLPGGRMPLLDMLQQRLQRLQRRASRSGRLGYERLQAPGDEPPRARPGLLRRAAAWWRPAPAAPAPAAPAREHEVRFAPPSRGARSRARGTAPAAAPRHGSGSGVGVGVRAGRRDGARARRAQAAWEQQHALLPSLRLRLVEIARDPPPLSLPLPLRTPYRTPYCTLTRARANR
jgi:hypothetical protein